MLVKVVCALIVALCVFVGGAHASSYDFKYGNASLWYSEVAYCDPAHYLTRTYTGYTAGFVPTFKIEDSATSTYGFVGYQPSLGAIFVSYRG